MSASSLSVVFLGNDPWSVASLRALSGSRHRIARALTFPPRPAGRGSKLRPTAVAEAARSLGIPLAEIESARSSVSREAIAAAAPDVIVVVAFGEILTREVLEAAPLGAVNVHFSLLPALRGASPVRHALLLDLEETGVTTMLMDEGLDTGPTLLRSREPIHPDDDAGSLGERLAGVGARLIIETLDGLAAGTLTPTAQDENAASWAPRLSGVDRRIDWAAPAAGIVARIRAWSPSPGASTSFRGEGLKVFRAELAGAGAELPPISGESGTVLEGSPRRLIVAAGASAVRLLEVGPAGRRRMGADAFVNGFHPEPGELLGR